MKEIAFFIIMVFALFLIFAGFLMFFNPEKVKRLISKAGSSYLINFVELIPRLIIGLAFVFVETRFEIIYNNIGCFLIATAVLLMVLPIKIHNSFSKMASDYLKPIYFKFLAPISILFGILIIYGII